MVSLFDNLYVQAHQPPSLLAGAGKSELKANPSCVQPASLRVGRTTPPAYPTTSGGYHDVGRRLHSLADDEDRARTFSGRCRASSEMRGETACGETRGDHLYHRRKGASFERMGWPSHGKNEDVAGRLLEKHERGSVDDGRGGYCASDADPCQWDRPLSGGCGCWHRRWIGSVGK